MEIHCYCIDNKSLPFIWRVIIIEGDRVVLKKNVQCATDITATHLALTQLEQQRTQEKLQQSANTQKP